MKKNNTKIKIGIAIFMVIVICLSIMAVYSSYAFVTTTVEHIDGYDYTFVMDINKDTMLNVVASKNAKTILDLNIKNSNNDGTINYGVVYSIDGYDNSNLLPNIDVYKNVSSVDETSGKIAKDEIKKISIIIDNREKVDLKLNIKVLLGYEFGGDLLLSVGEHLIYSDLKEQILYNNGGISTILEKNIGDESGMYATIDNYGDSYYYKGENNNYIVFGEDKDGHDLFWKIIRINGDGSIKLLYLGTDINNASGIFISSYNILADDNAYVGYMYGDIKANSYEETHANNMNSNIKGIVDNWYKDNLIKYNDYIADTVYCNNRQADKGFANEESVYVGFNNYLNKKINLLCNLNDSFNVTTSGGNKKLTYPISLLSLDEVLLSNLKSDKIIWTITPSRYLDGAKVYAYSNEIVELDVNNEALISPVVSLKENVKVNGIGSKANPYKVIVD